ncbi:uncharacterized protein EAF01_007691 [Botrytis porri]|uniref:uncharacterized protein n=1 Tax=Botrytis porri TaxID=87229 RepID=UPI0018FF7C63|nr:uncharacterized protein EAF01_007691 [Botrytis porri]KAF7900389.1 hypothetical protein EAF01_007691 [Botrytis porri]
MPSMKLQAMYNALAQHGVALNGSSVPVRRRCYVAVELGSKIKPRLIGSQIGQETKRWYSQERISGKKNV